MKTICVLNGRIVMSQDGIALEAMEKNAAQHAGATARVVTDAEHFAMLRAQTDWAQEKIKEVKIEAFRRILLVLPSGTTTDNFRDKESNMLARSDELHRIVAGTFVNELGALQPARALTSAETAELTQFSRTWRKIKAIRAASNLVEADIVASTDPGKFDVAGSARWPTP